VAAKAAGHEEEDGEEGDYVYDCGMCVAKLTIDA
jgi:hypothetical protein